MSKRERSEPVDAGEQAAKRQKVDQEPEEADECGEDLGDHLSQWDHFKDAVKGFLRKDALYVESAEKRRDLVKELESLPAGDRAGYLEKFATEWFRMATLADESYGGRPGPWSTKRYQAMIDECKKLNVHTDKFRSPMGGNGAVVGVVSPKTSVFHYIKERDPSMWMADMGDQSAEIIFRGTNKWHRADRLADGCLFAKGHETEEWDKHFTGHLVDFIRDRRITRLSISGHSLGGFRACTIGLNSNVIFALTRQFNEGREKEEQKDPLDVLRERVTVVAVDPAGTSVFPNDLGMDGEWNQARASVITTISQSVTLVSGYATPHIAPLNVFDMKGYKGIKKFRAVRPDEATTYGPLKLSPNLHPIEEILKPMEFFLRGLKDFSPVYDNNFPKGGIPSQRDLAARLEKQVGGDSLEPKLLGILVNARAHNPARNEKK